MTIDTQGMSLPTALASMMASKAQPMAPPMPAKKLTAFTPQERNELKQIFREVLDEFPGFEIIEVTDESSEG